MSKYVRLQDVGKIIGRRAAIAATECRSLESQADSLCRELRGVYVAKTGRLSGEYYE